MLRQLAIHNIVLVERLELEFEPGLGVLTGETGAGKSILLDALGLALGARADTGLVRPGEDGASVSAEIELPQRSSRPSPCSASRVSRSTGRAADRPPHAQERRRQPRLHRRRERSRRPAPRHRRAGGRDPRPARRSGAAQSQGPSGAARRFRQARRTRGRARLGRGHPDRGRARSTREPRRPPPNVTANGSSMPAGNRGAGARRR